MCIRDRLGNGTRSRKFQLEAGGASRRADDQGGHIFANIFNPPKIRANHFAQNGNFNQGVFRQFERGLADLIEAGNRIDVNSALVSLVTHCGQIQSPLEHV